MVLKANITPNTYIPNMRDFIDSVLIWRKRMERNMRKSKFSAQYHLIQIVLHFIVGCSKHVIIARIV